MAVVAALVLGCGGMHGWRTSLATRAAFDTGCPEDQLAITELGNRAYGVEGCGCRATYLNATRDRGARPTWVLNTTSGTCQSTAGGSAQVQ